MHKNNNNNILISTLNRIHENHIPICETHNTDKNYKTTFPHVKFNLTTHNANVA